MKKAGSTISQLERLKWADIRDELANLNSALAAALAPIAERLKHSDAFFYCASYRFGDLVLLRNVLMYFETPMKLRAIDTACGAVAPGGYLYVGDVDPIRTTPELTQAMKLKPEGPGLYHKSPTMAALQQPIGTS